MNESNAGIAATLYVPWCFVFPETWLTLETTAHGNDAFLALREAEEIVTRQARKGTSRQGFGE